MKRAVSMFAVLLILPALPCPAQENSAKSPFARWEKTIAAFEAADAKNPPAKGGVLFVGSSSIRMWKLDKWFPDSAALNRGFGGSQVADSLHFADRIILPYEPSKVVVYAGDNDIAAGKSPETVASDFRQLVAKIHTGLPETDVLYIAIKPSTARWKLFPKMAEANRLIQQQAAANEHLTYIDIVAPMLGDDGQPRPELFLKDGLHMTDAGYEIWTSLVRAALK